MSKETNIIWGGKSYTGDWFDPYQPYQQPETQITYHYTWWNWFPCPFCGYFITDPSPNYCSRCGKLLIESIKKDDSSEKIEEKIQNLIKIREEAEKDLELLKNRLEELIKIIKGVNNE